MNSSKIENRKITLLLEKYLVRRMLQCSRLVKQVSMPTLGVYQGMRLAVAHSPVSIRNFGGQLECISMVAYRAIGNKIDNIMVVR